MKALKNLTEVEQVAGPEAFPMFEDELSAPRTVLYRVRLWRGMVLGSPRSNLRYYEPAAGEPEEYNLFS